MSPIIRVNSGSLQLSSGRLTVPEAAVIPGSALVPGNPVIHWDFTDITQLFQDTANSTPVTANGQSVNSVDDKGSLGITLATNHAGTPNAPTFTTNVNNGLSGLVFDVSNTEGLVSDDYDLGLVVTMLCICIRPVADQVGVYLSGPSQDTYLRIRQFNTNIQAISVGTKATQVDSPTPPNGVFAAWSNGTTNSGEVSLSTLAGSDEKTGIAPSNPASAPSGVGVDETGVTNFLTGTVLEVLVWDNAVSAVPTTAEMETYATDKHLVTWA